MFVSANTTPFLAETFPYQDKQCVKWCVAVVRATFDVDSQGNCTVSKAQSPFVFADTHYGDPETTSIRVESDFVPTKPKCEVVLDARAVAPGSKTAEAVEVALIGPGIEKRAIATGQRRWYRGVLGIQASRPEPFLEFPLAWHLAFGGWDRTDPDPAWHRSDAINPIGTGYLVGQNNIDGTPLPCVESPSSRMRHWNDRPTPIGSVPCHASPRPGQSIRDLRQALDGQCAALPASGFRRSLLPVGGGRPVARQSFSRDGLRLSGDEQGRPLGVKLPDWSVPVRFMFDDRTEHKVLMPDTLVMVPHEDQIILIGRAVTELPRKFVKLQQVQVGVPQQPRASKPHYAGLKKAIAALARQRAGR